MTEGIECDEFIERGFSCEGYDARIVYGLGKGDGGIGFRGRACEDDVDIVVFFEYGKSKGFVVTERPASEGYEIACVGIEYDESWLFGKVCR